MGWISKWLAPAVVVTLLVAPTAEGARKRKKPPKRITRVETHEYQSPSGTEVADSAASVCVQGQGCILLVPRRKETYVSIELSDATELAAPFLVTLNGRRSAYCGSSARPIWLNGASEVEVAIAAAAVPNCPGAGSSGTLRATFSNRP